jgi:hypothetical protein
MQKEIIDGNEINALEIKWQSLPKSNHSEISGAFLSNIKDVSNHLIVIQAFIVFLFGRYVRPEQIH